MFFVFESLLSVNFFLCLGTFPNVVQSSFEVDLRFLASNCMNFAKFKAYTFSEAIYASSASYFRAGSAQSDHLGAGVSDGGFGEFFPG